MQPDSEAAEARTDVPAAVRDVASVFLVAPDFDPSGGTEEYVTALAEALAGRGVGVTVFSAGETFYPTQYTRRITAAGARLVLPAERTAASRLVRRALTLARRGRRAAGMRSGPARYTGLYPALRPVARDVLAEAQRTRPDLVHICGARLFPGDLIPHLAAAGLTTVYSEHATVGEHPAGFNPEAVDAVAQANALTADSPRARDALAEVLGGDREIAVIRLFASNVEPAPPPAPGERLRVACVARLDPDKGLDTAIEALALTRCFELTVAGAGPEEASLKALARRLGVEERVRWLGEVPLTEVERLLAASDAFVLASRSEGSPISVQEAMAAARPVVVTAVGDLPDVVRDGIDGLLVPPGDAAALAGAMERLAADAPLRGRMGIAARASWEERAAHREGPLDDVLEAYRRALAATGTPHTADGSRGRGRRRRQRAGGNVTDAVLFATFVATALLPEPAWRFPCRALARVTVSPRRVAALSWPERYAASAGGSPVGFARAARAAWYEERVRFAREWLPLLPGARVRLAGGAELEDALAEGHGAVVWVGLSNDSFLASKKALWGAGFRPTHLSRPGHGYFLSPLGRRWLNRPQLSVEERFVDERVMVSERNGPAGILPLVRRLREGQLVTVTFDDTALRPVPRPFLGGRIEMPPGPARLAALARAPLFPAFTERRGRVFVTTIGQPLPVPAGAEDGGLTATADALLAQLEPLVRREPVRWAPVVQRAFKPWRPRRGRQGRSSV